MDHNDTEMTEREAGAAAEESSAVVRELLSFARQLIDEGKPAQALQALCFTVYAFASSENQRRLKKVLSDVLNLQSIIWNLERRNVIQIKEEGPEDVLGSILMQWLEQVVMAMRTQGGDEAVFQSLHRARELYRNRLQGNTAVDQLAALFAECAIAEAQPLKAEAPPPNASGPSVVPDAHGNSILAKTGRMQIVLDAFSDGSSFICLQCGGLVSNHRKDEHYAYWCSTL